MNITIHEYSVSPLLVIAGTRGSEGMSRLSFTFDEVWDGLAKKVLFVLPDGRTVYKTCHGNEVEIPREVMRERGKSRCYVVGRRGKKRLVSVGCELLVLYTPVCGDTEKEGSV